MHMWGDETFDWDSLGKAGNELSAFARRWGRFGLYTKEKWGCLRASTYFWDGSLHGMIWPGHMFCRWRWIHLSDKWASRMWHLDIYFWPKVTKACGLRWLARKYQTYIYGLAYRRILKKYPHIETEILHDCEYPEYVDYRAEGVVGSIWRRHRLPDDTSEPDIPRIDKYEED